MSIVSRKLNIFGVITFRKACTALNLQHIWTRSTTFFNLYAIVFFSRNFYYCVPIRSSQIRLTEYRLVLSAVGRHPLNLLVITYRQLCLQSKIKNVNSRKKGLRVRHCNLSYNFYALHLHKNRPILLILHYTLLQSVLHANKQLSGYNHFVKIIQTGSILISGYLQSIVRCDFVLSKRPLSTPPKHSKIIHFLFVKMSCFILFKTDLQI